VTETNHGDHAMKRKQAAKHGALATFIALKMDIDERLARLAAASDDHFHKDPDHIEPPRDSRRLEHLRNWSHEQDNEILPGSPGTRGSSVSGSTPGARF